MELGYHAIKYLEHIVRHAWGEVLINKLNMAYHKLNISCTPNQYFH